MLNLRVLYFTTTVGTQHKQIPYETAGSVVFYEVLSEIAKKLILTTEGIAVAPPGGAALVYTDYQKTVDEIINIYGPHFSIINRGIVGSVNSKESKWIVNPAERAVLKFPDLIADISPNHPRWFDRVKLEIKNISSYLNFLQRQASLPFFFLKPCEDPKYKYCKWDGWLKIPGRPEIKFDMVILLATEYPKMFPKCFIEDKIVRYSGKIYLNNVWEEEDRRFVMICHDHIKDQSAWEPHLSIAHFFIREVWFWWNAQANSILREWDKNHSISA